MADIIDIYKKVPILKKTKEHVIQAGLGCDIKSQSLISAETNGEFSRQIDKSLVEAFVLVQAILGFRSRRGKPISAVSTDGSYEVGHGVAPTQIPKGKPWSVIELPDGSKSIQVKANTEDEARFYQEQALAELGLTKQNVKGESMTREKYFLDQPLHFETYFGGPFQNRAVAKSCLNLLGHHMGGEFVLDSQFDGVRDYVLEGLFSEAAMMDKTYVCSFDYCMLDARKVVLQTLPEKTHPLEHHIIIFLDPCESIAYAIVRLFGSLPFTVVLADPYTGPKIAIVLRANPIPSQRMAEITEVDFGLMTHPTKAEFLQRIFSLASLQSPVDSLVGDLMKYGAELIFSDMTQKAMVPLEALPEGTPISPETLNAVAEIIAHEYAMMYHRIDSKETIE